MPELVPDPTQLSRLELLQLAQSLGVSDADVMTRAELRAAIDKARHPEPPRPDPHPITWVSVARRLLASVVERGLNLPDAASLIRGDTKLMAPPKAPPPVATVTLARIYGAQGHLDRAIATLNEVLASDPDHEIARDLRDQLELRRTELSAREAPAAVPMAASESVLDEAVEAAPVASLADDVGRREASSASPSEPPASVEPPAILEPQPLGDARLVADDEAPLEALPVETLPVETLPAEILLVEPEPIEPQPPTLAHPSSIAEPPLLTEPPPLEGSPAHAEAPPLATKPDESAELVAPAFDVVERVAPATEAVPGPPATFYTEPPTVVGTRPLEFEPPRPSSDELETEPPATITSDVELPPAPAVTEAPAGVRAPLEPAFEDAARASPDARAHNGLANGVSAASTANGIRPRAERAPASEPDTTLPARPGLVLIETDTPIRYVYWELAASALGAPHWIVVVSHTPTPRGGSERHERRFPVQRRLGALRLEGIPPQAVVRARLTSESDTRPLVVAGAVRPRARGASAFEIRYTPHASAKPEALASRAQPLLEQASAVYWDW